MITRHTCLDNEVRTGQEADCPVCRVLLLEAFRAPVQPPRAVPPPDPRRPHLLVPPGLARTVDLGHPQEHADPPQLPQADCPRCGNGYLADRLPEHLRSCDPPLDWTDPDPDVTEHVTEHGVTESKVAEGGTWWVRCSCGWKDHGGYARDANRTTAARVAQIKADKHRENPT